MESKNYLLCKILFDWRQMQKSGQISGLVFRSGFGNGRLIIVAYNVKVTRRNRRDDQMDSVRSMGATE